MYNPNTIHITVAGKTMSFETGKIARQAGGSVVVRQGDTMILATACSSALPVPDADFLPLRIDYSEKFSSAGRTLGGFIKREGKPSEKEILVSRLIDRPLRPMFMDGYHHEIQVLTYVLSYDGVHAPEPLAINGASAALVISEIPLVKPIGAVRVGFVAGQFVVNPTIEEQKTSKLDLVLAGTDDAILMIEGYCDFLTEEQILEAIDQGHEAIKEICQGLSDWQKEVGKEKQTQHLHVVPSNLHSEIEELIGQELKKAFNVKEKESREDAIDILKAVVDNNYFNPEKEPQYKKMDVQTAFKKLSATIMRNKILDDNCRSDGRHCAEIRPIKVEMSLLPRTHGSALFTRGETQSLAVCTLGGQNAAQKFENLTEDGSHNFYLQYSFPPFSVGEVGRIGPPGRREVGHGKLAERALAATVPGKENFPYTIRLESNITESNGSSSMASVCGGCLAMMDAGVPIKRPIAGIAMGLILEEDRYAILSDILGVEDALGDMDFKITGDKDGVTAFQLDIKVEGINRKIMQVALAQAKAGRIHILNKMLETCPKSREQLSQYAPRIETLQVKPSKIAVVIGPGGKQIRAIIEETGVEIDINDQGVVNISAHSKEAIDRAKEIIHNLTADVEIGKVYKGKIVSIVAFGVFVAIYSKEGLCHISELSHQRIENISDYFKEGDLIDVKVIDINDRGQIKLSHKACLPAPINR